MLFLILLYFRSSFSGANALIESPKLGEDPTTIHALEYTSRPLWLNYPSSSFRWTELTLEENINISLGWASQLGMSALNGFSVVFQKLSLEELVSPSLNVFISIFHKTLMDRKVFDTEIVGNSSDRLFLFTHCSRNISGGFTVMGVNLFEDQQKLTSKLPTATTGSKVEQYILTQGPFGEVQLNGKKIDWNTPITPHLKTKNSNRFTTFTMPSKSVCFWVFSEANIRECRFSTPFVEPEPMNLRAKTGSEKLLQKLLVESVINPIVRSKRDLELLNVLKPIEKIFPEKTKVDSIQQHFLNKMSTLIKDLQGLTNHITAPTINPLQEELKKIEVLTKTDDTFPIKVGNLYEPHHREQMRQKCKIIAHTLEKQCLQDLDPLTINMLPMRGLNVKRVRRNIKPQVVQQFDNTEDIHTNMILKANVKREKSVDPLANLFGAIYTPRKENKFGVVAATSTPQPTPITSMPVSPASSADQILQSIQQDPNGSPGLLNTFCTLASRILHTFTRHITRFWDTIIDDVTVE